jgi:hypothetical protein
MLNGSKRFWHFGLDAQPVHDPIFGLAGLVPAVALGLSLTACQDTKAREENEQLKAHVLQLQKDAGELGNRVDVLTKEDADLRDEIA